MMSLRGVWRELKKTYPEISYHDVELLSSRCEHLTGKPVRVGTAKAYTAQQLSIILAYAASEVEASHGR